MTDSLAHLYGSRAKILGLAHFSMSKGMVFYMLYQCIFASSMVAGNLSQKPPPIQSQSHAKESPHLGTMIRAEPPSFARSHSLRLRHAQSNLPARGGNAIR